MANLYDIVNKIKSARPGLQLIGYTSNQYENVLKGLEEDLYSGELDTIFGINRDYRKVKSLKYDEDSGLSTDTSSGLWKIPISVTGSCPVYCQDERAYCIAKFDVGSKPNVLGNPLGHPNQMCPPNLSSNAVEALALGLLTVGAGIPLGGAIIDYFNRFVSTNLAKVEYEHITDLVASKCLCVQVIFPDINKSLFIDVLQGTRNNTVCLYIPTVVLGTKEWCECGLRVKIKCLDGVVDFIPNGVKYECPLTSEGMVYNVGKHSIRGYDKARFRTWCKSSVLTQTIPVPTLKLQLATKPLNCFIRLFVPSHKIALARQKLPDGINLEVLYKTYEGEPMEAEVVNNEYVSQDSLVAKMNNLAIAWSDVGTNSGEFSITYSQDYTRTLYRAHTKLYYSSSLGRYIKPIFGPIDVNTKDTKLDCSGFACFMIYNLDIIRPDVTSVQLYGTGEMHKFADYLNKKLKEGYLAKHIDITGPQDVRTGDVLYCTEELRSTHLEASVDGHAAWAYVKQNTVYTLESYSRQKGVLLKNLTRNNAVGNNGYFYKHAIRIILKKK